MLEKYAKLNAPFKLGGNIMKLSAPTQVVWIIAVVIGVLGILAALGSIPGLSAYAFWIVVLAWAIFVLSTAMKGL